MERLRDPDQPAEQRQSLARGIMLKEGTSLSEAQPGEALYSLSLDFPICKMARIKRPIEALGGLAIAEVKLPAHNRTPVN